MSEMNSIPATAPAIQYIEKAGVYLLQPTSISEYTDKNGQPKADKNGNPGITIMFKDVKTNRLISANYYYSRFPVGDPKREDPNLACKSEFMLTNLKAVLGYKNTDSPPIAEFTSKKFWGRVKEVRLVDDNGELVNTIFELNRMRYDVYDESKATKGRPSIAGDPDLGDIGGEFVETKRQFTSDNTASGPVQPKSQQGSDEAPVDPESQDTTAEGEYTGEAGDMPDF